MAGQEARVAVIAVHGVADQVAGDTVRALAELLVSSPPQGVRYDPAVEASVTLPVPPLAPTPESTRAALAGESLEPALGKAWRQSRGSDFERGRWVAAGGPEGKTAFACQLSLGARLTDFLLFKALRNGMAAEPCKATRLSTRRDALAGVPAQVDLFEMYWADLSRLSGGVPRIVTEMFTLLFRLSLLGRDTVRFAALADGERWRCLRRLQTALDWAFSRVLALLTLQLAMVALVIVPMGWLLASGSEATVRTVGIGVLGAGVFVAGCYRGITRPPGLRLVVAALAAAGVGGALWALPPPVALGLAWLVLLSAVYHLFLRACEERFPLTLPLGWVLWALSLGVILWGASAGFDGAPRHDLGAWIVGAVNLLEVVLLLIVVWWFVCGGLMIAWMLAGSVVARGGAAAQAAVASGRLGLFMSIAFYLVLVMAVWALVSTLTEQTIRCIDYRPIVFVDYAIEPLQAVRCLAPFEPRLGAADFVHSRYEHSTRVFVLLATLAFVPLLYLVVFFSPSVLAELKVRRLDAQRLGRWLSAGLRHLDVPLLRWLVGGATLLAALAGCYFIVLRFPGLPGLAVLSAWIAPIDPVLGQLSQRVLAPLVIGAAGATLAVSALGGVLSKYLPWLRAPLDVALDVDNHFREFPRRKIPRARIFSRYAALLDHVAAKHYDRVVIVAHSQGTVISAELLRYLHERGTAACAAPGATPPRISLLTLGCPLRQLYAARFPTLYDWVQAGPRAADLGVQRWVNAYTTGDYVGRWLWHESYDAGADVDDGAAEVDVCLGSGAHTHYLEADQAQVARWVDRLIAGR